MLIDSSGPQLLCALAESEAAVRDLTGTQLAASILGSVRAADATNDVPSGLVESLPALDSIAVGIGPGSFIGTRTAISFANGYAAAASRPIELRGVNSLAAIAVAHGVAPVLRDARRGQWYLWTPESCAVLDEAGVLASLASSGTGSVVLEWLDAAEPPLAARLRAIGMQVQLTSGVTSAGLLLAAQDVEPRAYVEPIYLRGFT